MKQHLEDLGAGEGRTLLDALQAARKARNQVKDLAAELEAKTNKCVALMFVVPSRCCVLGAVHVGVGGGMGARHHVAALRVAVLPPGCWSGRQRLRCCTTRRHRGRHLQRTPSSASRTWSPKSRPCDGKWPWQACRRLCQTPNLETQTRRSPMCSACRRLWSQHLRRRGLPGHVQQLRPPSHSCQHRHVQLQLGASRVASPPAAAVGRLHSRRSTSRCT